MKPSEHNIIQKAGSQSDGFSEVVERFNPFTSAEEKAAFFQGAANKPKKRTSDSDTTGGGGGGGGGFGFFGDLLGETWLLWIAPAVMLGLFLLAICMAVGPAFWLAWRLFRKPKGPNNDFVGIGWTVLGTLLAWLGMSTLGVWLFVSVLNWKLHWQEVHTLLANPHRLGSMKVVVPALIFIIGLSWRLWALIGGLDLLRKNRAVVALVISIVLSLGFGAASYHQLNPNWLFPLSNPQDRLQNVSYPFVDQMRSHTLGLPSGILWDRQGAIFSAVRSSRIEYPGAIPRQGTLEFWIRVNEGYRYNNYRFMPDQPDAMIFSSDVQGGDVTWPGTMKIFVTRRGGISLRMATGKYDRPPAPVTQARATAFRFGKWHALGFSYGSQGQYIMLDGKLVASAPGRTQTLGEAGNHQTPLDIPTIGETVSHYWPYHQYEGGFDGALAAFRVSARQEDWSLSLGLRNNRTPGNLR